MLKLLIADIKMIFRNRQSTMWALAFPLVFTCIFGFFFGENSSNGNLIIINNSNSEIAKNLDQAVTDSKLFTIKTDVTSVDEARDLVKNGKVAAVLVIPENFGALDQTDPKSLTVIEDPANSTTNTILLGLLRNFSTEVTYQINRINGSIFSIQEEKTNDRVLTYFDFVLSGVLGLALMNSSVIFIAVSMAKYREDKILKRLTTTPMRSWWFVVSEVISRLLLNFLQITVILLVGKYGFHAHIYGNIFSIYFIALLGGILFQLLGFVVASFTKTTDAAEGAATAITIPMMFLGGVFFPIDGLPHWLFSIVQYLPIAPLLRLMRSVVLDGASVFSHPLYFELILAWIVVLLLVSTWKFRLSEE